MSYDLTIRSDESYSRSTQRAAVESFIKQLPGVKPNGKHGFALDARPKKWMEIDLEVVNEEGDNIERGKQVSANINCIRLHIPYKFLADDIEHDYLPTAFAIAEHTGWTLYDDQEDEPILKIDDSQTAAVASPLFDRVKFHGDWVAFPYSFCNTYMTYSLSPDGKFGVIMIDDTGSQSASARGTWDLVGESIQWTYESCKGFPRPRKPELNKVLHVDDGRLEILEKSGVETKFCRPVPSKVIPATFTHTELRPFLERLIQPIDGGFATLEIDSLMLTANALLNGQSQKRVFKITFQDSALPFCIQISISSDKTVAASFSAPAALAEKIAGILKAT